MAGSSLSSPPLDLTSVYSTAYHLTKIGYFCIPVPPGRKGPAIKEWEKFRIALREVSSYFNPDTDTNIGLMTGVQVVQNRWVIGFDVDVDDELLINRILLALGGGDIPRKRGKKGLTFIAVADHPVANGTIKRKDSTTNRLFTVMDILSVNHETVIPPSIHPETGMPYEWIGTPLTEVPPSELPLVTRAVFQEIELACKKPESPLFAINTMMWAGESGGGDIHQSTLTAVAAMVNLGWSDDLIWARVDRATAAAVADAGEEYNWSNWEEKVIKLAADARAKGFAEEKKKQNPHLLAARWFSSIWKGTGVVRQRDGNVMVYHDGWYETYNEQMIRRVIAKDYPEPNNVSFIHEDWAKVARTIPDISPPFEANPTHRICLQNCTYDVDTQEALPHSPDDYLIAQLKFDYDPDAKCPVYDRFIGQTFENPEGDDEETRRCIDCFEEFVALTLFEDLTFHKFLVIKGPTGTGKSTLNYVIRNLHSPTAVSSVGVQDWGNERYKGHMVGKLVNVTGEVAVTTHASDSFLKEVTAGDMTTVRFLYREPYDTVLPTRLIVACNELFHIRDTSGAVERRMIILPCERQVPPEEMDNRLWAKLLSELPGIFNRIVRAWPRLRDRPGFLLPRASASLTSAFSSENNHPGQWLTECTHQGMAAVDKEYDLPPDLPATESTLLFANYSEWSKTQGYRQISSITWGTKLNQTGRNLGLDLSPFNKKIAKRPIKVRPLTLLATPDF